MSKYSELKAAVESVGAKSWSWWTSNSFLRLTFDREQDGGALSASVCRDGVATINANQSVRDFIEQASPAAILELLKENERLQAEVQEARHEVEILERENREYEGHGLLLSAVCYRLGREVGDEAFGAARLQRVFLLCHASATRLLDLLTKRGKLEVARDDGFLRRVAGKGGEING